MPELVEGTLGRGAMPEDAHYGSPQGAFPLLEELNKQWERGKLQSPCTLGRVHVPKQQRQRWWQQQYATDTTMEAVRKLWQRSREDLSEGEKQ